MDEHVPEHATNDHRYEIAADAALLGVWDWDVTTNAFFYSPRAREICGFAPDAEVTFEQILAATHPDDLPWTSALAERALDPEIRAKEPYRYRIVRADTGEVRWVIAHGRAVFDFQENPSRAVRYIGTLQDVTDQKLAEDELASSEERLHLAIDAGRMAVWELDLDAQTVTPSPELNLLCGFPPNAKPSLADLRSRYAPGEAERLEREGAEIRARGETSIQTEFKQLWPDGTEKWLLLRAQLVPPSDKIQRRVIGVLIDITDRKRAEQQSALVAREMQHRVKNTLAVVQALAQHSLRHHTDMQAAREALTGRLQAFAVATDLATGSNSADAPLRELVETIVGPYRRPDADPFHLSGPDVTLARGNTTTLALALHELCTNALKYGALSVPGGEVWIDWSLDGGSLNLRWKERNGPSVVSPSRRGFGSTLIERGTVTTARDQTVLDFEPDGVRCEIGLSLGQRQN